jgi:hypothetical protein
MPAFHGFPIAMFDHDLECKLKIARHVARLFWKPTARRGVCHACHVSVLFGEKFSTLVMFALFKGEKFSVDSWFFHDSSMILRFFPWFSLFETMVPIDPGSTTMLSGAKQDPSLCGIVGIPPGPVVSASHTVRRGLRYVK